MLPRNKMQTVLAWNLEFADFLSLNAKCREARCNESLHKLCLLSHCSDAMQGLPFQTAAVPNYLV